MKIIRIITRLSAGGPSWQAEYLSRALAVRGHETLLVCGTVAPGESTAPAAWRLAPRRVRVANLRRPVDPARDMAAFATLLSLLRAERPDVVHTHQAKAGALGRLAARMAGVPVVVHTFHGNVLSGYFGPAASRLVVCVERRLARISTALVAVSPSQKRELAGRFRIAPEGKIHLIPLGADLAPFAGARREAALAERLGLPAGSPVVAIVARLSAVKNVGRFLEVAVRVLRERNDARFLVVGDGPERARLESRARALGVAERTHFLGHRDDVAALYPLADVVCCTSRNEGTPLALIEAMAAGRAVVAHAVGGIPDLLEDGRTGLLTDPADPEAFARKVVALLADLALRRRLGEAARAQALSRHGAERLAGAIEALYRSLLDERD